MAGQVKCIATWGSNSERQLNVPPGLTDIVQVAAGSQYSAVLKSNGTVVLWGLTNWLDNDTNFVLSPPPLDATNIASISAGYQHCLALRKDGTVLAWGSNTLGQTNVPPSLSNIVAVAAGRAHCLALKADRHVVGWGYNVEGQATPPNNLSNVVAIAAGAYHSLAIKADGTVVAWGGNDYYQRDVPPGLTNVVAVAANETQSLALKRDGTLVQWGSDRLPWYTVPPPTAPVAAIGQSGFYSIGLMADSTVAVWGDKGSFAVTAAPSGLTNIIGIAAGYNHAVVLYISNVPPHLEYTFSGSTFQLSWPAAEQGFFLLSATNLAPETPWYPVSVAPVTVGDRNVVGLPASRQAEYFRLEGPSP